ncbi:hypothetical protein ACQPZF_27470 [Actinosynnema sp. CS-041913]|uniref:hypothetical protein n=1 Tax=Actinosynnema sp. CS-041913 TaxID=3239917 RepID=UPI003D908A5D
MIIAGAGAAGLMLAAELSMASVPVLMLPEGPAWEREALCAELVDGHRRRTG